MRVGFWFSKARESCNHYMWNTKSERAQFHKLNEEVRSLASRIDALQAPKFIGLTGLSRWIKPLVHRVTLGYAFASSMKSPEESSLLSQCMQPLLHRITGGVAFASTLPVLRSLYQEKQQELDLCRKALQQSAAIKQKKVVRGSLSAVAIIAIVGLFAVIDDLERQRESRRKWKQYDYRGNSEYSSRGSDYQYKSSDDDDWFRKNYESSGSGRSSGGSSGKRSSSGGTGGERGSVSSKDLPVISLPLNWNGSSPVERISHFATFFKTLEKNKINPSELDYDASSRVKKHNAWMNPLLGAPKLTADEKCPKKVYKACQKLVASVNEGAWATVQDAKSISPEIRRVVTSVVQHHCPTSERLCEQLTGYRR